jgi:hypothetical protein
MNDCIIATELNAKGYSIDWRDIVRPSVLKRDKYKCSHCGLANRVMYCQVDNRRLILDDDWLYKKYSTAGFKINKVALNIAHECHTKACINELHLLTLCDSCHLRYDKHIHVINRLINAANKRHIK